MKRCVKCSAFTHSADIDVTGTCAYCIESQLKGYLRKVNVPCPNCSATGKDPSNPKADCDWCDSRTTITTLTDPTKPARPYIPPSTPALIKRKSKRPDTVIDVL